MCESEFSLCLHHLAASDYAKFFFLIGVSFDIDLPNKKVYIDSEHNVDTLLETLKKTGKNASYLGEKSAQ